MSHFLARLVERARGDAPRAEPIIAPLFAPADVAYQTEASQSEISRPESSPRIVRQNLETKKVSVPAENPIEVEREHLLLPPDDGTPGIPAVVRQHAPEISMADEQETGEISPRIVNPPRAPSTRRTSRAPDFPLTKERLTISPNESRDERPIVRVTIGRIEVRAAPALTVPRKTRTEKKPQLTLDAYLKERKEGAR